MNNQVPKWLLDIKVSSDSHRTNLGFLRSRFDRYGFWVKTQGSRHPHPIKDIQRRTPESRVLRAVFSGKTQEMSFAIWGFKSQEEQSDFVERFGGERLYG